MTFKQEDNKLKKTIQGINILEVFFEKYKYSDQQ
jgi:hypothetical protein